MRTRIGIILLATVMLTLALNASTHGWNLNTLGQAPFLSNPVALAFELALGFSFVVALNAVIPNPFGLALASLFLTSLACGVNARKIFHLGEPILASDRFLWSHWRLLWSYGAPLATFSMVLILLGLAALLSSALSSRARSAYWRHVSRFLAIPFISIGFLTILLTNDPLFSKVVGRLGLQNAKAWRSLFFAREAGFFTSNFYSFRGAPLTRPDGMSKDDTIQLLETIPTRLPAQSETLHPSGLVVILLESFSEPLSSPNTKDPIPNLRRFAQRHTQIAIDVPAFGGKTGNSEFEILTGLPLEAFPASVMPLVSTVERPFPSLASFATRLGWEALGLHNYYGYSWKRRTVWPLLGFKKMLFLEELQIKNAPVTDGDLFSRIGQILDEPGQKFVFAVTMDLHGPYPSYDAYVEQLRVLDKQIGPFLEKLEKSKYSFFLFSDHLPSVTKERQPSMENAYIVPAIARLPKGVAMPSALSLHCAAPFLASAMSARLNRGFSLLSERCTRRSFKRMGRGQSELSLETNLAYDLANGNVNELYERR